MQLLKLACSALLAGSPLLCQLQFFNSDSPWISNPPVITADQNGNTYVISNRVYNATNGLNGGTGLTVTKLDPQRRVIYSYIFPDAQYVTVGAAVVDSKGSLIIGGSTNSSAFPVYNALLYPRLPTSVPLDERGFVSKLSPQGDVFLFSTLVGGNELDYHYYSSVTALALDAADNIYVTGATNSPTFPITPNVFQKTGIDPSSIGNRWAGYLMKVSSAGDTLLFSTYLGVTNAAPAGTNVAGTVPYALSVDGRGIATVAGSSLTAEFPITPGAYDCRCSVIGLNPYIFISRFNADASALEWSTLLPWGYFAYSGEGVPPRLLSMAVDAMGNVTVAGTTTSTALPTTTGVLQTAYPAVFVPGYTYNNVTTGFLATVSSDGRALLRSTYFGGTHASTLHSLAQDTDGSFWVSGEATPGDLPASSGSLNLGSGYVARVDASLSHVLSYYGIPNGGAGLTLNLLPDRNLVLTGSANTLITFPETGPQGPSVLGVAGAAEPSTTLHITPGELITVYGTQLGPVMPVSGTLDSTGKFSTSLGGYRVLVNGTPAPLLYAGLNQINLVVPFGVAQNANASLQIFTPAGSSPVVPGFVVGPAEPQVFPVMLNQDGSINSMDHPAPRNSTVTMWATGAGGMDAGMLDGQINQPPLGKPLLPVAVKLWPHPYPAAVTYAGAAPGMIAGVIQVNFQVPPNGGLYYSCISQCYVELLVGDRSSLSSFAYLSAPIVWVGN